MIDLARVRTTVRVPRVGGRLRIGLVGPENESHSEFVSEANDGEEQITLQGVSGL